uniref:Uncharacterized protein n=1 Tax=Pristionchus pacificus TaxID=54126 RepID=A0A8R1Z329_PRIPA
MTHCGRTAFTGISLVARLERGLVIAEEIMMQYSKSAKPESQEEYRPLLMTPFDVLFPQDDAPLVSGPSRESSRSEMVGRGYPITLSKLPCFQFSFELRYEQLAAFQVTLRAQAASERACEMRRARPLTPHFA